MNECSNMECNSRTFQRGLCRTHYEHFRNGELAGRPMVYYATHTGAPYVKIGFTTYLVSRTRTLAAQLFHAPTLLIAAEPGDRELERHRHAEFHAERLPGNGELFRWSPGLLAHLSRVRDATGTVEARLRAAMGCGYADVPVQTGVLQSGHLPGCPCRCGLIVDK